MAALAPWRALRRWLLVALLGTAAAAAEKLRVQFFDVGQGDATLITCPDGRHHVLIDSGDNKYPGSQDNLRSELSKALGASKQIDVVVASHPHSDHIGGMEWVLKNYSVRTYIDNGRPAETTTWGNLDRERKRQVKTGKLTYIDGKKGSLTQIKVCDGVVLTLITPSANTTKLSDPNDQSVGVRLDYQPLKNQRGASFLFVGDMEEAAEKVWLDALAPEARKLVDVDVLKVGHHGSDTSSSVPFINAASPDLAFVMCGAQGVGTNIRYQHPRASTLRHYGDWFKTHPAAVTAHDVPIRAYNAETKRWQPVERPAGLWASVVDGTVTVETDGTRFFVSTAK
ncbi:MAG: MBL fold metallo-hydrolase [Verrucomicrobia bacterium]|nr:MBL fold metallo-hydrolase [Verrucomicrobiota bacterium]